MSENSKTSNTGVTVIKTGLILFVITAAAAFALAVVNSITAPVIAINNTEKTNQSMENVLPTASEFIGVESSGDIDKTVTEIYKATDDSGETIGVCVCVSPNGYGGAIDMVVGVDLEGKVTGVDIINQSETAGLGARSVEPEFRNQYVGKGIISKVVKIDAKADEIQAISSATITSKAVTAGVNTAIESAEKIIKGEQSNGK